jgi:hypothetical protein
MFRQRVLQPVGPYRSHERGFILLSSLAALLLISILVIGLLQQAIGQQRLASRLSSQWREAIAEDAVHDRLLGLVADSMFGMSAVGPELDSTPFFITEGGQDFEVRVQDVEGLLDVYLATPEALAVLPIDVADFLSKRQNVLSEVEPGQRFPVLVMSLAQFGAENLALEGLVTQFGQSGTLRTSNSPSALRALLPASWGNLGAGEQVTLVEIGLVARGQ